MYSAPGLFCEETESNRIWLRHARGDRTLGFASCPGCFDWAQLQKVQRNKRIDV
jgi:hypothetical protein